MKYKKIIELLPTYTLFIFLLSSNSACSNGQANNKQTEDAVTDTITTFVYPESCKKFKVEAISWIEKTVFKVVIAIKRATCLRWYFFLSGFST